MELLTTRSSLTPCTGTRGRQRGRPMSRVKARPERRDLLFITCAAIPLDATTRKASIGSLPPGEIVTRCVAGSHGWGLKASIPLSSLGKRPTIPKGLAELVGRNTGQTLTQLFRASRAESDIESILSLAP